MGKADGNEYEVQQILYKKVIHDKKGPVPYYLVHWKGYPEDEATWEPIDNLDNAREKLTAFEKKWKEI